MGPGTRKGRATRDTLLPTPVDRQTPVKTLPSRNFPLNFVRSIEKMAKVAQGLDNKIQLDGK